MKKLSLNPDALEVESFAADDGADEASGTVQGHAKPPYSYTCPPSGETYEPNYTCDEATCLWSCYNPTCSLLDSCDGTCTWM